MNNNIALYTVGCWFALLTGAIWTVDGHSNPPPPMSRVGQSFSLINQYQNILNVYIFNITENE